MKLTELPIILEELQSDLRKCKERIRELESGTKRARHSNQGRNTKVHLKMFPTKYDSDWLKKKMEDMFGPVRYVRINPVHTDTAYTWASVNFEDYASCDACLTASRELEDRYGFQTKIHQDRVEKKRA